MQVQSADEVWSRIESLTRAEPGGVLATDADGTLWSGDVGEDLFHAFLREGRVEPSAAKALGEEARAHAVSDAGSGAQVARRIYDAYLGGNYPEERICELMTWCFGGWTESEVTAFAREVVDRAGLASRVHGDLRRIIEQARGAGLGVFLVSASPTAVVVEAGSRVGFDPDHVVAARPRYTGDVMIPEVDRPIPYGPGKVVRLRERLGPKQPLLAAFGDNAFDVALLASARVPIAVRPKPRLRERAADVAGLVELSDG